jgi:long-subunit fatty acid transport protein
VFLVALAIALRAGAASGQTNIEVNQGIQIDFANPGARSLAMGGAFVGLADDATAALANPAGLRALSLSEISFEGRAQMFKTPYVYGGRLTGTPTNIGIDTISGPQMGESSTSEGMPAFVSGVYASAKRRWALAAFRHEQVKYSTDMTTSGAFTTDSSGSSRYFPVIGDLSLHIVDYGVSGSYKWQKCDKSGACNDSFAIGAGLNIYTFNIDSLVTRYNFNPATSSAPGFFYGPPVYTQKVNYQTQTGDATQVGATIGALIIPDPRFQLGLTYRKGVVFDYTAQNFSGTTNNPFNSNSAAQFHLPDAFTIGAAIRPAASTVVVVDFSHVMYSQMMNGFLNVFPTDPDEQVADYSVPDANQFRIGGEHQFTALKIAPAIRIGTWFDPDHALRNSRADSLFRPGTDVWHFTAGGGVVAKPVEFNVGFDLSKRGNIVSVSAVVRF